MSAPVVLQESPYAPSPFWPSCDCDLDTPPFEPLPPCPHSVSVSIVHTVPESDNPLSDQSSVAACRGHPCWAAGCVFGLGFAFPLVWCMGCCFLTNRSNSTCTKVLGGLSLMMLFVTIVVGAFTLGFGASSILAAFDRLEDDNAKCQHFGSTVASCLSYQNGCGWCMDENQCTTTMFCNSTLWSTTISEYCFWSQCTSSLCERCIYICKPTGQC